MKAALDIFTNPELSEGTFAAKLCSGFKILDEYPNDPNRVSYKYTIQSGDVNVLGILHGGAIATMIDVLTSVTIAKVSPYRNVSVNLST